MPQDNRIRLDAPLIDFATINGLTGQAHDTYPAAGQQARYDHLRSFLTGLLSCQSSESAPTQYREGTLWFDTKTNSLKIRSGDSWVNATEVLALDIIDNNKLTLKDWYDNVNSVISTIQQDIVIHYLITSQKSVLPIPTAQQQFISSISRPFVYVDGILLNPIHTTISNNAIILSGFVQPGQQVFAVIKTISSDKFNSEVVVA